MPIGPDLSRPAAITDVQDAVSDVVHGSVMSRSKQGNARLLDDIAEELHDFARGKRVEVGRWFVGDDETRSMHEGTSQSYPLLLAAGEFQAPVMGANAQPDHL